MSNDVFVVFVFNWQHFNLYLSTQQSIFLSLTIAVQNSTANGLNVKIYNFDPFLFVKFKEGIFFCYFCSV